MLLTAVIDSAATCSAAPSSTGSSTVRTACVTYESRSSTIFKISLEFPILIDMSLIRPSITSFRNASTY